MKDQFFTIVFSGFAGVLIGMITVLATECKKPVNIQLDTSLVARELVEELHRLNLVAPVYSSVDWGDEYTNYPVNVEWKAVGHE